MVQGLAALAAISAVSYGFVTAGFRGALTGLVAAIGIGSAIAIAVGERGTGVFDVHSRLGFAQRTGGFLGALFCAAGAYRGGWSYGWLWGIGGYALGIACAVVVAGIAGLRRRYTSEAAQEAALESLVQSYGAAIEAAASSGSIVIDQDQLPAPKENIKSALLFALHITGQ